MIYFIRNERSGDIKIGYAASNPLARMRQLQTATPDRLVMLGFVEGDRGREASLHRQWKTLRLRRDREWFTPDIELETAIRELLESEGLVKRWTAKPPATPAPNTPNSLAASGRGVVER